MTLEQAKKEIQSLNKYIELVEKYEVTNINQWVIKNYALTNSVAGVIKNSLQESSEYKVSMPLSRELVINVIKSKPQDQLHRIVRSAYLKKIRKVSKY